MATLKEGLLQRDLESFETHFNDSGLADIKGRARLNGGLVRAAIAAGWIDGLTVDEVGGLGAAEIRVLGDKVSALYTEATAVDPNS
jgi:hypothetical protein